MKAVISRSGKAVFAACAGAAVTGVAGGPLNMVLIVADDLGWKDVGYNGAEFFETPNIDQLAARGLVFDNAYAAGPVCSPTRASIMTGKSPARTQITNAGTDQMLREAEENGGFGPMKKPWPPHFPYKPPYVPIGLPAEEKTVAEYLKEAGYATACIGKWHLSHGGAKPQEQGFDVVYGGGDSGWCRYFPPYEPVRFPDPVPGEYLTDRLTREAVSFIEQNKDRPFFLYLAHFAPHDPYEARQDDLNYFMEKNSAQPTDKALVYAAMLKRLDDGVGQVFRALEKAGISERTVIVFWSDNGPEVFETRYSKQAGRKVDLRRMTRVAPLRGQKAWLYEGGIRVPAFMVAPGVRGGTVCSQPVITTDLMPTILELAGLVPDDPGTLDGESLVPLIKGGDLQRDILVWHYPHWGWPASAIRQGRYKLIHFYGRGSELYDLEMDIGEKNNLTLEMPEKTTQLQDELFRRLQESHALLPTPNPDFNPEFESPEPKPEMDSGEVIRN